MVSEGSCITFLKIVQTFDSRAYVYNHEDPFDLNLMYWSPVQCILLLKIKDHIYIHIYKHIDESHAV